RKRLLPVITKPRSPVSRSTTSFSSRSVERVMSFERVTRAFDARSVDIASTSTAKEPATSSARTKLASWTRVISDVDRDARRRGGGVRGVGRLGDLVPAVQRGRHQLAQSRLIVADEDLCVCHVSAPGGSDVEPEDEELPGRLEAQRGDGQRAPDVAVDAGAAE